MQPEPINNKSPKPTPTKSKKNHNKESSKKEDETKDSIDSSTSSHQNAKEIKEQHNDVYREVTAVKENSSRDSKKSKKKNNFLAQLGTITKKSVLFSYKSFYTRIKLNVYQSF